MLKELIGQKAMLRKRERERERERERSCRRMESRRDERSEISVIIFDIKAPVMAKYLQQQKKEI